MKKTYLILLVMIAAAIVVLISYTGDLSSYETVASAKQKEASTYDISGIMAVPRLKEAIKSLIKKTLES